MRIAKVGTSKCPHSTSEIIIFIIFIIVIIFIIAKTGLFSGFMKRGILTRVILTVR